MQDMCHEMSSNQLDALWNYESFLANALLDLPQRKCSAVPNERWGTEMPAHKFLQLKSDIRKMWCRAAQFFVAFKSCGNTGWGLKVRNDLGKKLSISANSFTILGWLARAPSPQQCATGHRYLRSPAYDNIYLGGPISLAQLSNSPTVQCQRSVTSGHLQFGVLVHTLKAIDVNTEVTWTYSFRQKRTAATDATSTLYSVEEWFLRACCRELNELSSAQRKELIRVNRPVKTMRLVTSYFWCTFCGSNLEEGATGGRVNRKEHWATHHAVDICTVTGLSVDEVDPSLGVDPKAFKTSLELVDSVLHSLRGYNYSVIPASHFLANSGISRPESSNDDSEDHLFEAFKVEAEQAFRKYKVVYLKGIKIPDCFADLIAAPKTNYRDVLWLNSARPRSNQFAVKNQLTPEEMDKLDHDIMVEFQNIVFSYQSMS